MEENYKDLYLAWNQEGTLKDNLIVISMLVKANIAEKQICKFYQISIDNLKWLKKKYFDFAYAFDKDNITELNLLKYPFDNNENIINFNNKQNYSDEARQCILFRCKEHKLGLLVDSQGFEYVRYGALVNADALK